MSNQPSLNVTVVLHVGIGSFEQGFAVRAEIFEDGHLIEQKDDFVFSPAPEAPRLYRDWQVLYREMGQTRRLPNPSDETTASEESENNPDGMRAIKIPPQTTHHSDLMPCQLAAEALERYLQAKPSGWFNHSSFQHLRDWIRAQTRVKQDQSVPVIFDFKTGQDEQNALLKRLPWHLWDLFTELKNTEVALYGKVSRPKQSLTQPVKILAIFGSGEGGLELEEDIKTLQGLKSFGADVQSEREPSRERLHKQLFNESWDILFFAGHSSSDENLKSGHLLVGEGRQYSLDKLRVDLQTAVNNGLKMAIFNSCDGLGIADFLINLKIPTVIVFREPVPDLVARKFLENFLKEFSSGKPLYRAVREARDRLHWLEGAEPPYPCASWLPVIYQNPSQPELVWPPAKERDVTEVISDQGILPSHPQQTPDLPIEPTRRHPWKRYGLLAAISLALLSAVGSVWHVGLERGSSLKLDYFSLGEKGLIDGGTIAGKENQEKCRNTGEKQAGNQAFAKGNFPEATNHFRKFLQSCPFDAETQIYYNNAKALSDTGSSVNQNPFTEGLTVLFGKQKTLRVAVSVPIGSEKGAAKGARVDAAQELLRGPAIAQYNINKNGGINGKLLLIEIADDDQPGNRDLSDRIKSVGSELAADPAILAVIGPYDSKATHLIGDAISDSDSKLTVISPTSTAVRKSPDGSGRLSLSSNILRTATTDAIAAQKLADDIHQAGKSRVTVIYDESDLYSKSLKEEFEKAAAKERTQVFPCNLAEQNTNPDGCLNQGNPDALLWIPPPEIPDRAINFIMSNERLPVWAGDAAYGSSILKNLGDRVKGMKIFVPWAVEAASNSGPLKAFEIDWLKRGIDWRTGMAYDATEAIAQALRQMGNTPNRQELRGILLSPDFKADGILGNGTVQFTHDGEAKDGVGVGDRKLSDKLGVIVEVKCNPTCRYSASK